MKGKEMEMVFSCSLAKKERGCSGGERVFRTRRTASWAGLWTLSYMPVSMETTSQLENQTASPTSMEEPQGSYLDSPSPKRIP